MGSQLETTVIRNGEEKTFRLSVGGDTFETHVFWGLEYVLRCLQGCEVVDYPVYTAEGGGVVDFDRKLILWYGGQVMCYDASFRRAFRTLAIRNWSGWDERWADEGPETIKKYLGQDYVEPVVPPNRDVGLPLVPAEARLIREELPGICTVLSYGFSLRFQVPTDEFTAEVERRKAYLRALEREFLSGTDERDR
jgi:hypothetical protein